MRAGTYSEKHHAVTTDLGAAFRHTCAAAVAFATVAVDADSFPDAGAVGGYFADSPDQGPTCAACTAVGAAEASSANTTRYQKPALSVMTQVKPLKNRWRVAFDTVNADKSITRCSRCKHYCELFSVRADWQTGRKRPLL